eukprot:TRINITY_DN2182_c0_g1_i1.p1 TRINITY_DN2182_c0_g1~~TRINITY_DN2182_c0_g1_i1.p1  ORF type:complete len:1119 (-),score=359.50 TRINITY_DN2182_c0_g1_i1:405-3761(-)
MATDAEVCNGRGLDVEVKDCAIPGNDDLGNVRSLQESKEKKDKCLEDLTKEGEKLGSEKLGDQIDDQQDDGIRDADYVIVDNVKDFKEFDSALDPLSANEGNDAEIAASTAEIESSINIPAVGNEKECRTSTKPGLDGKDPQGTLDAVAGMHEDLKNSSIDEGQRKSECSEANDVSERRNLEGFAGKTEDKTSQFGVVEEQQIETSNDNNASKEIALPEREKGHMIISDKENAADVKEDDPNTSNVTKDETCNSVSPEDKLERTSETDEAEQNNVNISKRTFVPSEDAAHGVIQSPTDIDCHVQVFNDTELKDTTVNPVHSQEASEASSCMEAVEREFDTLVETQEPTSSVSLIENENRFQSEAVSQEVLPKDFAEKGKKEEVLPPSGAESISLDEVAPRELSQEEQKTPLCVNAAERNLDKDVEAEKATNPVLLSPESENALLGHVSEELHYEENKEEDTLEEETDEFPTQSHGRCFVSETNIIEEASVTKDGAFAVQLERNIDGHTESASDNMNIMFGCFNAGAQVAPANVVPSSTQIVEGPLRPNNSGKLQDGGLKKTVWNLVRIPRHIDNKLRADIRLAQIEVDDKTEKRDFIRTAIQLKRAKKDELFASLKSAREKARGVRETIRSKRQEMEPVQALLMKHESANIAKNIDEEICQLQYTIAHETMELNKEKQLMAAIKSLKRKKEEILGEAGLSSNRPESFEDINSYHDIINVLKQELDSLKIIAAEEDANVRTIDNQFNEIIAEIKRLQEQWNAADAVRQEAYESLKALKKQEFEMNTEFYQSRKDSQLARQYAQAGDRESLETLSSSQVERILLKWNKDTDFRKDYVKDNERSTLKRLGTLDGRSLGPDEEPPLPTNYGDELETVMVPHGNHSASRARSVTDIKVAASDITEHSKEVQKKVNAHEESNDETASLKKKPAGKSKKIVKEPLLLFDPDSFEITPAPQKNKEDNLLENGEDELMRKEKIRQEEMRKSKEAEERKRRQAEKKRAKEAAKAQKEAERKEKERQKRANKKAAAAASLATKAEEQASSPIENIESGTRNEIISHTDNAKGSTVLDQNTTQRKKSVSQKTKRKPVFPGKRSKRGWQKWIWTLLAILFCLLAVILWVYL